MKKRKLIPSIFLFLLVFFGGILAGYWFSLKSRPSVLQDQTKEKNQYLSFIFEVYDTIEKNYWKKLSEKQLVDLFVLATEKLVGQPQSLKKAQKTELRKNLEDLLKQIESEEKKKEFSLKLADLVLANLEPFGRSRLYTKKEEKQLSQTVRNITQEDYYQILEVSKEAKKEEIEKVYQKKKEQLEKEAATSPQAKEKLNHLEKAYQTLADEQARQLYNEQGIEPTITYQLLSPTVLYLRFTKISPTTLQDLDRITKKFQGREGLNSLIIDLRDNIGGSVDSLPYLLGPFIGNNQYAYQFFHQGEVIDFKTRTGWLPGLIQYKKVVILINENTQSSAEIMASVLKKYNVGVLVGKKTKGWGTIEKVFPLKTQLNGEEKYSLFLVHSLTLREDGQPIEGNGVLPVIDIEKEDWQKKLTQYYNSPDLNRAVAQLLASNN